MIGHDVERGNNFTTCGSSETTRDIFFLTTEVLTLRRYSYARKGGHINRDAITSNDTVKPSGENDRKKTYYVTFVVVARKEPSGRRLSSLAYCSMGSVQPPAPLLHRLHW